MKQQKDDISTYIINGLSLLGRLTTLSLTNRLDDPIPEYNRRAEQKPILLDKVVGYQTESFTEYLRSLRKSIRVVHTSEFSKEVEEEIDIGNDERLLINCRKNEKRLSEDNALNFFIRKHFLNLTSCRYSCKDDECKVNIDINALMYGIRIVTDLIVNIPHIKDLKIEIDLKNLGKSKRYMESIIKQLNQNSTSGGMNE